MILAIQGLSKIKLGNKLKLEFRQRVFDILENFLDAQSNSIPRDLTLTKNVRLLSCSITAVNATDNKNCIFNFYISIKSCQCNRICRRSVSLN